MFKATTKLAKHFSPHPNSLVITAISALLLVGCTSMAELPEGSTYAQIQQQYGSPTVTCENSPFTLRVWSQQPMGYYAWRGVFDDNDQLVDIQQVLSDPIFAQVESDIGENSWDLDKVGCNFGPPAEQSVAPYIGVRMKVWSYRYKQNNVWPMMMNIFFDDNDRVHALQRSMDPRDNDGQLWMGL